MQSYWVLRRAVQSLFWHVSTLLSVEFTFGKFGRSQFRISGRWAGTRKDCLKGVRLNAAAAWSVVDLRSCGPNLTMRMRLYLPTKLLWMNFQAKRRSSWRGSSRRRGSFSSKWLCWWWWWCWCWWLWWGCCSSWPLEVLEVKKKLKLCEELKGRWTIEQGKNKV